VEDSLTLARDEGGESRVPPVRVQCKAPVSKMIEGLCKIRPQIFDMLDPNRQPH
jgi:hypothetical protein